MLPGKAENQRSLYVALPSRFRLQLRRLVQVAVHRFALSRESSYNHGAVHQVVTCTSEREVFGLLPGRVENMRSLYVVLP